MLITAPARSHTDLVVAAAAAGKHVFCEKPMAVTLADADRAIAAAEQAGVVLQVGFNRRFAPAFAAARAAIDAGRIGTPQLLRSLTRDPGPFTADPARIPQWTIFFETLIHDFDTLCFLNPGARPVAVHAFADALVAPEARDSGLLDTAVVTIRFDNGAHRDGRGQLQRASTATTCAARRSARGHGHRGHGARHRHDPLRRAAASTSTPPAATPTCCTRPTRASRRVRRGRAQRRPVPGRRGARPRAPRWPMALAAVESVETGEAVTL